MRARILLAAGALFCDDAGRVLLLEPSYKDTWEIPGGVVDWGESPAECCEREIREELGLARAPGRLLVVDFCRRPYVQWEGIRLIFDGGVLTDETIAQICLSDDELEAFRLVDRESLARLAAPQLARRVAAALDVGSGETRYLENGEPAV